jgi:hypothetical protein
MNPAFVLLANKSLAFGLYDFHCEGVSAQQLASVYSLPVARVEEHIEAVHLCLKYQVEPSVRPESEATVRAA